MDLIALLGEPRRGLAILSGIVAVAATLFVWLNAEPGRAAGASALLIGAALTAVPAAREELRPGLVWLLASIVALAAGLYIGYA